MSFSVINVECPEEVVPNTRFKVTVTITNEEDVEAWFTLIMTDLDTGQRLDRFSGLTPAHATPIISSFLTMPDRVLNFELRLQNIEVGSFTVYPKVAEEPPKACIIATVFLGQQHPFLPPMRKFRDRFIPRQVMDAYYSLSVFFLRKMGKLSVLNVLRAVSLCEKRAEDPGATLTQND